MLKRDDIIVYAKTNTIFCQNLQMILERLIMYGITANPDKTRLGMASIEYLGHVIDKDGIHFTKEKIQKVVDFPTPVTVKELQSFIGLANYFRDHIDHHSSIIRPLLNVLLDSGKRITASGRNLKW